VATVKPLRPDRPAGRPGRRPLLVGGIIVGIIVFLVVLFRVLGLYVEWLWFGDIDLRVVFWTTFWSRLVVGIVFAVAFFLIVWGNVELARRLAPRLRAVGEDVVEYAWERIHHLAGKVAFVGVALLAIGVGYVVSRSWLTFQKALHAESFGAKDPIFGHDIGFYIFTVPAWHYVQSFIFACLFVSLILAGAVHLLLGGAGVGQIGFTVENGQPKFTRPQQLDLGLSSRGIAHLSGVLAAMFVVVGVGQLFKAWDLLFSADGVVFGATYTDVHAVLPATRVLMAVAFALAAVLLWNMWRRLKWWPLTVGVWVVVLLVAQLAIPAIMQALIVKPNELSKEREFIGYNLAATRRAYDLTSISEQPLATRQALTEDDLEDNEVTLRNIRLWDPGTLVTSYRQLQELRPYYSFVDADVDRYEVNGVLRQTMVSARELNIAGLPANAQTWVNQHITYTHGYGVTLSAVNQVTADGSPDFLVKDMPPQAVEELKIEKPQIYYGEIGTDYTLVNTTEKEFDFPGAGGDVYAPYSGEGGIPVSSFLNRLAFNVRYRTIKFFTTAALTGESRIIIRNNINEILASAAPFLQRDKDPYLAIAEGRLKWVIDCYTTTDRYAYSQPESGLNYIRNSVKAVIDAYDGTLTLYAFDPQDPILRAYARIFPGAFTPAERMPEALRRHVRYAQDYFDVQARVFATYHVTDPEVLYNKGDQWQIPANVALSGSGEMQPYYVIMRLPGEEKEEFLLIMPFVPNGRKNMVSWLGARSDPPNYGKAVSIVFSKGSVVYGPSQVEAAINQDPKVSAQLTLWDRSGSKALSGNLLVVPIADALLYVQPLYLQAEETKLPQLKQVIVFYQMPEGQTEGSRSQIVAMQPTLGEALADVFGSSSASPTPEPTASPTPGVTPSPGASPTALPEDLSALIALANQQFEAADEALRRGDWAEYGRQIDALEATLRKLSALQ